MATLDDSDKLTIDGLRALLAATPPSSIELEGRVVQLKSATDADTTVVQATWDGGGVALRFVYKRSDKDRNEEDAGHGIALGIITPQRHLVWTNLGWAIRDAMRAGLNSAELVAQNSYFTRNDDRAAGRDIAGLGPASRATAARAGLGAGNRVVLGAFSIDTGAWQPDPGTVLTRCIKFAIIKAHFSDRGDGVVVSGAPLFAIPKAGSAPTVPTPTPLAPGEDRLAGLQYMVGPVADWVDMIATLLEQVEEEEPTEEKLIDSIASKSDITNGRATLIARFLRTLRFVEETASGTLALTDDGALVIEGRDKEFVFRAVQQHFTGLEETLAAISSAPDCTADDLLVTLKATLGVTWETNAQARVRAYWLRACGLVDLDNGHFRINETGKRVLEALPVEKKKQPASVPAKAPPVAELAGVTRVQIDINHVDVADLVLPPGLLPRCIAALNAGKHLLLIGPPGTGKSTLAERLANAAAEASICNEALLATASADWTTYDTIGGWTQLADQTLAFREGVVCRALRERRWLVLDEVNRADIDKSFGELFSVLAGSTATTPYTRKVDGEDRPVEIGPDCQPYEFGPWFRLLATMNVRDKASLFRLSYAFLRRFAVVFVPELDDTQLRELGNKLAVNMGIDQAVLQLALTALGKKAGLGRFAPLGPSLLRDVLLYAEQRKSGATRAVAEAVEVIVLPQLDGLGEVHAVEADKALHELFSPDPVAGEVRAVFRSGFPHVAFAD